MPVPTLITDLSTTAASNFPSAGDSPSVLDDVQRAQAAFIAQIRDAVGMATGTLVPATARTSFGAAASGANADITSLTGITTPFGGVVLNSKIQPVTATVAANALTLTLNPTSLDFRSTTLTTGVPATVSNAAAITLVISSGSTLGTTSAQASRVAILAINNGGTMELAAINANGGTVLDETGVIGTTAEGGAGAADSATVAYSTTARTGVAYRVIGYVDSTQTTAGTWAVTPSLVQGMGGVVSIAPRLTSATAVTASGVAVGFVGIPSWVKRMSAVVAGVSGTSTGVIQWQLGTGGVLETTGYAGTVAVTTATPAVAALSTGFALSNSMAAATLISGIYQFVKLSGNTWVASYTGAIDAGGATYAAAGQKTLAGTLDTISLVIASGTFDAGSVNIMFEG